MSDADAVNGARILVTPIYESKAIRLNCSNFYGETLTNLVLYLG